MFFIIAAYSTPKISSEWEMRMYGRSNMCATCSRSVGPVPTTVRYERRPIPTSSACEGPESTAIR